MLIIAIYKMVMPMAAIQLRSLIMITKVL